MHCQPCNFLAKEQQSGFSLAGVEVGDSVGEISGKGVGVRLGDKFFWNKKPKSRKANRAMKIRLFLIM